MAPAALACVCLSGSSNFHLQKFCPKITLENLFTVLNKVHFIVITEDCFKSIIMNSFVQNYLDTFKKLSYKTFSSELLLSA